MSLNIGFFLNKKRCNGPLSVIGMDETNDNLGFLKPAKTNTLDKVYGVNQ